LQQLLLQASWDTDNPAELLQAQRWAFDLIDIFQECSGGSIPFSCPFDFTSIGGGSGGYSNISEPTYTPSNMGVFVPGTGWVSTLNVANSGPLHLRQTEIKRAFTAVSMDAVQMTFSLSPGDFSAGAPMQGIVLMHSGVDVHHVLYDPSTIGAGLHTIGDAGGPWTVDEIDVYCLAGAKSGSDPGGESVVQTLDFNLTSGDCPPFGP